MQKGGRVFVMKNNYLNYLCWIIGIVVLIIIGIVVFRVGFGENSGEDNWIKDSRGVWIKHGNPADVPDFVKEQQDLIQCSRALYGNMRASRMRFNSQCLGRCMDYSVDIVNVPRNAEDDKPENQCADYRNGITKHFIELSKGGEVVGVVE